MENTYVCVIKSVLTYGDIPGVSSYIVLIHRLPFPSSGGKSASQGKLIINCCIAAAAAAPNNKNTNN